MSKKTERYFLSYEKVSPNDWIATASDLLGLEKHQFGLYVVSATEGIYKVGR